MTRRDPIYKPPFIKHVFIQQEIDMYQALHKTILAGVASAALASAAFAQDTPKETLITGKDVATSGNTISKAKGDQKWLF